ncbi:pilus assembly protein [Streptomyces sp. ISL-43]|uniref:TadE/TadG family type IV pilus assembly protein n=1 Tax=Streptomyces sp. ISL-43 TaxID=2819183 RepID=UPI001BE83E98|nr:TadE/TadG family type IV pilus assembly protein [Streptomyces sp. ISL-43]MBT2447796.1 pilus assembly protein [Streptomyces sp. ISL-43]
MRRRVHSDRGQVALEYIGFIPILLLVALCGIQLGWVAYVHQQAQTAARTAARVEARTGEGGEAAGRSAISGGLAETADFDWANSRDAIKVTVTLSVNSVIPGLSFDNATATVTMPNDDPKG